MQQLCIDAAEWNVFNLSIMRGGGSRREGIVLSPPTYLVVIGLTRMECGMHRIIRVNYSMINLSYVDISVFLTFSAKFYPFFSLSLRLCTETYSLSCTCTNLHMHKPVSAIWPYFILPNGPLFHQHREPSHLSMLDMHFVYIKLKYFTFFKLFLICVYLHNVIIGHVYKLYLKTIQTLMIFEDLASIKVFYQFNLIRTMNLCISFWSRLKHSKT